MAEDGESVPTADGSDTAGGTGAESTRTDSQHSDVEVDCGVANDDTGADSDNDAVTDSDDDTGADSNNDAITDSDAVDVTATAVADGGSNEEQSDSKERADADGPIGDDDALTSHGPSLDHDATALRRFTDWVLFDGERLFVAALLTAVLFAVLVVLESVGVLAFENDDSITRLAGGMIAGTFSLVTLVVSINQLILSREFVSAGEAADQFSGVESFREDVASLAGVPVAPTAPARLADLIATVLDERAQTLGEAVDSADSRVRTPVQRYVEALTEGAQRVQTELDDAGPGPFESLAATVGFDDGWHRYVGLYLRETHGDALSDDAGAALDDVLEGLRLIAIAQEHVKTTTLQRELTRFSQLTILLGVPAVFAAFLIGFLYGDVTGATISPDPLPYVVSALVAVVFSPLALLAAYILRTATIARRTASTGPMLPTKDPEEGAIDVSVDGEATGEATGGRS